MNAKIQMDQSAQDLLGQARVRFRRKLANATKRAFAEGMMQGILSQLGPGDLVLDCGANVGLVTGAFAKTGATVLSFEPDPVAFEQITANCGQMPNVTLINAAVGVRADTATLFRSPHFGADPVKATVSSTLLDGVRPPEAGAEADQIEVAVLPLPDILRDIAAGKIPSALPEGHGLTRLPTDKVALLKLDIEGAELDLLEHLHAQDMLSPIGSTVVETHERKFPKLRPRFAKLRKDCAASYAPSKVFLDWV